MLFLFMLLSSAFAGEPEKIFGTEVATRFGAEVAGVYWTPRISGDKTCICTPLNVKQICSIKIIDAGKPMRVIILTDFDFNPKIGRVKVLCMEPK